MLRWLVSMGSFLLYCLWSRLAGQLSNLIISHLLLRREAPPKRGVSLRRGPSFVKRIPFSLIGAIQTWRLAFVANRSSKSPRVEIFDLAITSVRLAASGWR